MSATSNFQQLANFIWSVADLLRGPYRPPQYERVMLPLTVLRRFDAVLAPSKEAVLKRHAELSSKGIPNIDAILNNLAKDEDGTALGFHNHSQLDFPKLKGDPDNIGRHLADYIAGFSENIRKIFERFEFDKEIEKLEESNVNALMHRSYRSHAPVQIIRYSNRLEIRNPGFSLKSPDHLGEPGSLPRNPKLAAALYDTRFAETKGSGVRVMREMCEKTGLAPPLFESDRGQDQFVVRLFFHHFLGPDDLAWLARFRNLHLSEAEARALVVAREVGAIDNATWRDTNKVDTLTTSQSLKKLRDAGLLQQKGRGSATWYQPTGKMLGDDDGLSSNPEGLSSNPLSLTRDLGALSRDPNSLDKAEAERKTKLRQTLLAGLPGELAARVGALGRRSPPDAVRDVVLDLLQQRPWRLEELGQLLQRNPEYVRQKYVQPLLEAARIRMTRPEVPNDPEQAYRAVDERP